MGKLLLDLLRSEAAREVAIAVFSALAKVLGQRPG